MTLGMSLATFTTLHVIISLMAIAAGLRVLADMLQGKMHGPLTAVFLATTVLTSVTGFMFPNAAVTPAQIVGGVSLVALGLAILALYVFKLRSPWHWVYAATAVLSLYLNCFVAVVQAFQKLAFLKPLAPTQSEPPFLIAEAVGLAIFVLLAVVAIRKFRPQPAAA